MAERLAYLDHAATSPMTEKVLAAYTEALRGVGNPASTHGHGQAASEVLESARESIAQALGCDTAEVTLTSGGTEAINIALKGVFWERRRSGAGPVVLVAEAEHHATIEAAQWLRDSQGAQLEMLPVDADGVLQPAVLAAALTQYPANEVALISFLWANNEVGSVQPVSELCAVAAAHGIPVHVDAVSALGQLPVNFADSGAQAMSVSAHKIGGPASVGALVLSRQTKTDSLIHGGSQQRGRSGTQNVAGAVAFAAALESTLEKRAGKWLPREEHLRRMQEKRDALISGVKEAVPDAVLRGTPRTEGRLPGNAHFTFPGCQGDSLVFLLDAVGISASVGSACQAGVAETSHVLLAMGIAEDEAAGALRFTLSADTAQSEIDALLTALPHAVQSARRAGLS